MKQDIDRIEKEKYKPQWGKTIRTIIFQLVLMVLFIWIITNYFS